MRVVYQEYKREYANSTAFLIEPNPDPEVRNGYLVRHEKGAGSFWRNMHLKWWLTRNQECMNANASSGSTQVSWLQP